MKPLHLIRTEKGIYVWVDEDNRCPQRFLGRDCYNGNDNISTSDEHVCVQSYIEETHPDTSWRNVIYCECDYCASTHPSNTYHYFHRERGQSYFCNRCTEGNHPIPWEEAINT